MPSLPNTRNNVLFALGTAAALAAGCSNSNDSSTDATTPSTDSPNTTTLRQSSLPAPPTNEVLSSSNFVSGYSTNIPGSVSISGPSSPALKSTLANDSPPNGMDQSSGIQIRSEPGLPPAGIIEEAVRFGLNPIKYFVDTFPPVIKGVAKIDFNIPPGCTHVLVNIRSFGTSSFIQIPDEAVAIAQSETLDAISELESLYRFGLIGVEGTSVEEQNRIRAQYADPLGLKDWEQVASGASVSEEEQEAAVTTLRENMEAQTLMRNDTLSRALRTSAPSYLLLRDLLSIAVVESPQGVGQVNTQLRSARELVASPDPAQQRIGLSITFPSHLAEAEENALLSRVADAFSAQQTRGGPRVGIFPLVTDARHEFANNFEAINQSGSMPSRPVLGSINLTLNVVAAVEDWQESDGKEVAETKDPSQKLALMRKGILQRLREQGYRVEDFATPALDSFTSVMMAKNATTSEEPAVPVADVETNQVMPEFEQTPEVHDTGQSWSLPRHSVALLTIAGLGLGAIYLRSRARSNTKS